MTNNSINMIKALMSNGNSPQNILNAMMKNNKNQMIQNLFKLQQGGKSKDITNFARNLFKSKGKDFDKEFGDFMSNFKS